MKLVYFITLLTHLVKCLIKINQSSINVYMHTNFFITNIKIRTELSIGYCDSNRKLRLILYSNIVYFASILM